MIRHKIPQNLSAIQSLEDVKKVLAQIVKVIGAEQAQTNEQIIQIESVQTAVAESPTLCFLSGNESGSVTEITVLGPGGATPSTTVGIPITSSLVAYKATVALRHYSSSDNNTWTVTLWRTRNGLTESVGTITTTF